MSPSRCPALEALREPVDAVTLHLETCPACRARRDGLDEDERLLARVRAGLSEGALGAGGGDGAGAAAVCSDSADGAADVLVELVPGLRLGGMIAGGGQGVVHEAWDEATQRPVVVKLVGRPGCVTTRERLRCERERRLAARVDHPGVARLLAGGVAEDGRPYVVMERADGVPLGEHPWFAAAGEGPGPTRRRAVDLLLHIAEAVAAAHRRGVVHRDLKPSNVLVDVSGSPTVIDFGLACGQFRGPATEDPTITGEFVGSFDYAAPEQLAGDRPVDARADVHALGVIGYRMLAGDLPHATASGGAASLRTRLESEPRRPREVRPDLECDLDAILYAAVRREPGRRYADAGMMAADLRRLLEGRAIQVRADSRWERVRAGASRHRRRIAVSIAVGGVLAFVAASMVTGWRRTMAAERLAGDRAAELAMTALSHELDRAQLALENGDIPLAESLAWTVRFAADEPASAGGASAAAELAELGSRAAGTLRELYGAVPSIAAMAIEGLTGSRPIRWSADGRSIRLTVDGDRAVAWSPGRAIDGRPASTVTAPPSGGRWLPWHGAVDGQAWMGADGLIRLEQPGRPVRRIALVALPEDPVRGLWSDAGGRWVLVGRHSRTMELVDTEASADDGDGDGDGDGDVDFARAATPHERFERTSMRAAVSPDGRWFAVGRSDGGYEVRATAGGPPLGRIGGPRSGPIAFAPDGSRLALVEELDVELRRLPDLSRERTMRGAHRWLMDVAFDASGRHLVAGGWDRLVMAWRLSDGQRVATWPGHADSIVGTAFAPGGDAIASLDEEGVVRVWRFDVAGPGGAADTSHEPDAPGVHRRMLGGGSVMDLAAMPDGRLVAGLQDGRVLLLDADADAGAGAGDVVREWPGTGSVVGAVAVLPQTRDVIVVDHDGTVCCLDGDGDWGGAGGGDGDGAPRWAIRCSRILSDVAVHPDGSIIAVAAVDGTIRFLEPSRGRRLGVQARHEGRVVSLAFSPDGSRLASTGADGTVREGPAVPESDDDAATGGTVRVIGRVGRGVARVVTYDASGRWILFAGDDRGLHVVDRHGQTPPSMLRLGNASVFALGVDPRGGRVASLDAAGRLVLVDGPPWAVVQQIEAHPTMGFEVLFASGGRSVVTAGGEGTVAWRRLDTADPSLEGMEPFWRGRLASE